jgi:hypothetical protein
MLVTAYQSTWCRIPEDLNFYQHCCESLISHIVIDKSFVRQVTPDINDLLTEHHCILRSSFLIIVVAYQGRVL